MLLSANHWRLRNTVKAVRAFALICTSLCQANSEAKTILVTLSFFPTHQDNESDLLLQNTRQIWHYYLSLSMRQKTFIN